MKLGSRPIRFEKTSNHCLQVLRSSMWTCACVPRIRVSSWAPSYVPHDGDGILLLCPKLHGTEICSQVSEVNENYTACSSFSSALCLSPCSIVWCRVLRQTRPERRQQRRRRRRRGEGNGLLALKDERPSERKSHHNLIQWKTEN